MESLKKIVGQHNVLFRENQLIAYFSDASRIKGRAVCVVLPDNIDHVRRIIQHAKLHNMDIVPRGAGTSLAGGAVPQDSIVMDLSKMNKISSIDAEKMFVTVEPGVICDDLNSVLKKYDLVFPVIPSSSAVATIGGMLSANAAGLWAVKYGKAAEWVDEIEVVDGNNIVHKYSKKEDMMNFLGKEGITGIITRAKLKLTKLPKEYSMNVFSFYKLAALFEKMKEELKNPNVLSIEYIDNIVAPQVGFEEKFYLIVEYCKKDDGDITEKEEIDEIMQKREDIGPIVTAGGYTIIEDPFIPQENMLEFVEWLNDKRIPVWGHIGVGVVHPRFKEKQEKLLEEMFAKVVNFQGSVSGEHGIGLSKRDFVTDDTIQKMIELKTRFDSEFVLNKNKVIKFDNLKASKNGKR